MQEPVGKAPHVLAELDVFYRLPDLLVEVLSERVEVFAHTAFEDEGLLWDERDRAPKLSELNGPGVNSVDANMAVTYLGEAK